MRKLFNKSNNLSVSIITSTPPPSPQKEQKIESIRSEVFSYIDKGAVKKVWVKISEVEKPYNERSAYYTPRKSFFETLFKLKRKEIRREVKLMNLLMRKADKRGLSYDNLALKNREVSKGERVKGRYTVEVELARDSFESRITKTYNSLETAHKLGSQFLDGMAQLHGLGYAYGDVKPQNCLIYEDEPGNFRLKISDFGKTRKMSPIEEASYRGNLRYAPPEGRLSQKGDVYGSGLVMIRNLEETFLNKGRPESILLTAHDDLDMRPDNSFRGLEALLVEHKAFPAFNKNNFLKGLSRRVFLTSHYAKRREIRTEVLHTYIDELNKQLKLPEEQGKELVKLLKSMVEGDPHKRPTMQEASLRYKQIFNLEI